MRLFSTVLLCAGLTLSACSQASAPASQTSVSLEDDKAALANFGVKWRAAYEAADFDTLMDLYEPDAWLMATDKPARKGKKAIREYFTTSRASGSKASIVFENESRSVEGDYAFETAHWWLSFPREGQEPYLSSGRSFLVFKRGTDNVWRVWRDIDNHTPDVPLEDRPQ